MNTLPVSLRALSALVTLGALACSSDPSGEGKEPVDEALTDNPCGLETNYAGDENCILPPAEDEGMQIHVGPESYDDPDVVNAIDPETGKYFWIMEPGDESTHCYHIATPNETGIYYFEQQYRMRAGSHHMIISLSNNKTDLEPGWDLAGVSATGKCQSSIIGAIGGTQHVVEDWPPNGQVAPEDEGLARGLEPRTPLDIQLHFYNTTEEVRLREVWVNLYYKPKDEVVTNLGMLGGFTRMNIPPNTKATVGGTCKEENAIPPTGATRVVTLFGHAHTHNDRFYVNHVKANGSTTLVYDSYDRAEAPTYTYNSLVKNPAPDLVNGISGGTSGQLILGAGDQLEFACDVNNNTEFTFTGANEVNTDEMCNLFGTVAGLGFPCFALNPATAPAPPMP